VKIARAISLGALLTISSVASAQSIFNGTWRPNPQTFGPTRKADSIELINGVFECRTCEPPYKIRADGSDQAISGNPYYDVLSVRVIDDRTVTRTAKQHGTTVAETKTMVSGDGKTKTDVQTMYDMAPRPVEFTSHSTRLIAGPQGSHIVSGEWRMTDGDVTNHAEDTMFQVSGNRLLMSDRMGRSFSAKFDGSDAPYIGSDEVSAVSLKVIDKNTIEESDKKDGKVVKVSLWSVKSDGKTMHVRFDDTHGHVQEQDGHKVE